MTIDLNALKERLGREKRLAALSSANYRATGNNTDADFHLGRQAAFLSALHFLTEAENEAYAERDEAFGEGVNLAAVERLERFGRGDSTVYSDAYAEAWGDHATETGALDQASGTVYSDADGGL